MNKEYIPVSCEFVDWIEHFAIKKTSGTIIFLDEKGREMQIIDEVNTWEITDGMEYLKTNHGRTIRLDKIVQLYDVPGPASGNSATC